MTVAGPAARYPFEVASVGIPRPLSSAAPDWVREALERPTQRGVLCVYGFFAFLIAGGALLALEPSSRTWPVVVFLLSVVGLMGTSALYHRVTWSPAAYARMRRLDHAMIFALIVGTETPLFVIGLEGRGVEWLYGVTLVTAAVGFLITMFWLGAPKWVRAGVYLAAGWAGAPAALHVVDALGTVALSLLVLGGVLYSVGAAAYGLKRPNPWPGRFGYHEVFHAFVLAAAAAHFALVAFCL